jgi:hypothetical protein
VVGCERLLPSTQVGGAASRLYPNAHAEDLISRTSAYDPHDEKRVKAARTANVRFPSQIHTNRRFVTPSRRHAHGFRWNADGVWSRLAPGDTDPETGIAHRGPAPEARLAGGERIVVDEAGMLDQDTALALLALTDDASATRALVGDRAQLPAVGRGGVLDMAAALVPHVYDLTSLHRFAHPEYAAFTLDLRDGSNPARLFDHLHWLGLVHLHADIDALRAAVTQQRDDESAITGATNDEARELNALIHDDRVRSGLVDDARVVDGADGLPIGAGDLIQTRRNDAAMGVANRQTWIVQHIAEDGSLWVHAADRRRRHNDNTHLPADYVAEYTQLAYAATAYGVQGTTAPESHTVLSDALDAAGVYVGLTRGRHANRLHVVAADLDDAREQFVAAMERDRADRGLAEAAQRAHTGVAGLIDSGPVRMVNAERIRLTKPIQQAERAAALPRDALGSRTFGNAQDQIGGLRARAELARRDLAALEALPVAEAAQLLRDRAERAPTRRDAVERASAARTVRDVPNEFTDGDERRGRMGPRRGLGL